MEETGTNDHEIPILRKESYYVAMANQGKDNFVTKIKQSEK